MDFADFHIEPLPLETELRVISIQRRLKELSRQELEDYMIECLRLLTTLTHQTAQMKNFLECLIIEG